VEQKPSPRRSNLLKLTDPELHKRFVETAKKVDASDRLADFDKAFDALVHHEVNSTKRPGKNRHR
jgi:hypothetical protein